MTNPKIDIAANIKKLELAKQLMESAYHDLKNVRAFREQGVMPHLAEAGLFEVTLFYDDAMQEISDLIEAAKTLEWMMSKHALAEAEGRS